MSVDAFEHAFRRLLAVAGIDVGPADERSVTVDPVEPLFGTSPESWIRPAALHFSSVHWQCSDMVVNLAALCEALSDSTADRERISDLLYDALYDMITDDIRLHAFHCQLYGEVMRDLLLNSDGLPADADLRPNLSDAAVAPVLPPETLAQRLSAYSSLPPQELAETARVLMELDVVAKRTVSVLDEMIWDTGGDDSVLAARFANAQLASLRLASLMLSVDVVAKRLLPTVL